MREMTYKPVNFCEIPVTDVFLSLLSHVLSKWAAARGWNFIVYVFIHCEAGITDFTRSFKQLSECSIDWNVNMGSYWALVTQLEVRQLSSLSFIVSRRGKSVFLKLLIKFLQHPSGSGDLGKWKTRKWDVAIDCTIWNRGHLSVYIKWGNSHTINRFTTVTFVGSTMPECENEPKPFCSKYVLLHKDHFLKLFSLLNCLLKCLYSYISIWFYI